MPVTRGRLRLRFRLPRARTYVRCVREINRPDLVRYNIVTVPRLSFTETHPRCRLPLMSDSHERQQSFVRSFQIKNLLSFSLILSRREAKLLPPLVSSRSARIHKRERATLRSPTLCPPPPLLTFPIVLAHRGSIPDFDTVIQISSLSRAICISYVEASGEAASYLTFIFALGFSGFNEISGWRPVYPIVSHHRFRLSFIS